MSFLSNGAECAVNSNPLAQVSKRADFDTSLQNSIRNGSSIAANGQINSIHNESMMNQHDKNIMHNFMDQNTLLNPQNSFDFKPMSHELNNVIINHHNQPSVQLQNNIHSSTITPLQNWSAEFQNSNQAPVLNNPNQNIQNHHHHPLNQISSNPIFSNSPQMFRLRNPMMNSYSSSFQSQNQSSQNLSQNQNQQNDLHLNEKIDWEDSFKEIEKHVDIDKSDIQINEMSSVFDNEQFKNIPEGFNEKYHDEYTFEEKNEFLHNPNAYEIGCKLMEGGAKLSEAALAFEAAVQDDPKHIDAWLKLGQVQIQNEKELHGITALENCLLLDKKNLTALMSLAISYVNEGYDNAAFKTFENWIETKYPDIVSRARLENPNDTSDDRYSLNKRITNLFLKAAQLSPSGVNIDADVQTGLGVLFYSMEEYDKTLDCFQAAIKCNPNDALSWNRLGASYANSNRPEQAIEAYSKALQLNPNFVRARYNLGVSFINMGMYKDAIDHLLTGLSMHEVENPDGNGLLVSDTEQSSNLIETLKRAFLAMDRRDLIDKVRPGMNVSQFRSEYNF
jgi:peroxin-5